MKRNLLLSMMVCALTFLGISSVDAMEREKDLADAFERLSVSGSQASVAVPNPQIWKDGDGLHVAGEIQVPERKGIPGKKDTDLSNISVRLANDRDMLSLGEEYYPDGNVWLSAQQVQEILEKPDRKIFFGEHLGFVSAQRADEGVMEGFINGPRDIEATIATHWFGQAPGWRYRIKTGNPNTLYMLEKDTAGKRTPVGHFTIGPISTSALILGLVLSKEEQQNGIGTAVLHFILKSLIPSLYRSEVTAVFMSPITSLVITMDDSSSVASRAIEHFRRFKEEFERKYSPYTIGWEENLPRGDQREAYKGRTGYRWTIPLAPFIDAFELRSHPFTPSAGVSAAQ